MSGYSWFPGRRGTGTLQICEFTILLYTVYDLCYMLAKSLQICCFNCDAGGTCPSLQHLREWPASGHLAKDSLITSGPWNLWKPLRYQQPTYLTGFSILQHSTSCGCLGQTFCSCQHLDSVASVPVGKLDGFLGQMSSTRKNACGLTWLWPLVISLQVLTWQSLEKTIKSWISLWLEDFSSQDSVTRWDLLRDNPLSLSLISVSALSSCLAAWSCTLLKIPIIQQECC